MSDHTLKYMKANGIKLTRKNGLDLNYFGDPPELDDELEAEISTSELVDDVIDIRTRKPLE
jgi:hypothetical protein